MNDRCREMPAAIIGTKRDTSLSISILNREFAVIRPVV